jgi:poly(3-hydroxybutyrate) depolymerase
MDDTKYMIGIGTGASMLYTLIALNPDQIAAACLIGGCLPDKSRQGAFHSPVASYLINAAPEEIEFICNEVNHVKLFNQEKQRDIYTNPINTAEKVILDNTAVMLDAEHMSVVWNELFKCTRRTNTGAHGDIGHRMDFATAGFEIYDNDIRLGDQNDLGHTWITHIPDKVRISPDNSLPLLLFFHGASDTPAEAAEMSKFHELGAQEGFITVYPWSSNTVTWNVDMDEDGYDDISYIKELINYMLFHYPIDSERIYLSGFSNGAAMAQSFALMYPEMIAAICHIDSNWPGSRTGESIVDFSKIRPMAEGLRKKEVYDYRMPVWYTYGTREPSYPVFNACTQQHQYDFWKIYNNITVKHTPPKENPDPSGCGVIGDKRETLWPSACYPHHMYDVHRFYSNDPNPVNYYNYVMMHDKGHEVAPMDATLGWNYVKHFKRNSDGSSEII